jgi:poly(glycerol-phosphate) alpha-glucosyltransferase
MTVDKPILILTSTLQQKFGGRTKSLLQRARIFAEKGHEVTVYSTNQNDNYQDVFQLYRNKKHITDKVTIGNMFEDMGGFDQSVTQTYRMYLVTQFGQTDGYVCMKRKQSHDYYKNETRIFTVNYTDETMTFVKSIDSFHGSAKRPFKRAIVNLRGNIKRVRYYEDGTWQLRYEEYLDRYLLPFARMKLVDDKKMYQFLDADGQASELMSFKRFIARFLNTKITDGQIVINDARGLDYPVRLIQHDVSKIYVMHNPHLNDPLDITSGIKNSFKSILRPDLKANETIISLTADQKQSILNELPELDEHISVIGHAAFDKGNVRTDDNVTQKVGIISRLADQKNLVDAISAFAIFHKTYSEHRLEIYGKGDLEDSLRQQVDQLGISDVVTFHGFTDDVDAAYQSVDFTLNTSFYEGFPLAIIESISNGTPVLSYPVNFGPATILDERSGRIAQERTPEALAEQMVSEVRQPKERSAVLARSKTFSVDAFYQQWTNVL